MSEAPLREVSSMIGHCASAIHSYFLDPIRVLHGNFLIGDQMAKKNKKKKNDKELELEMRERAMVEGILEGSPDGVGVVVIRLDCGCRKMAAVSIDGEPASKIIMYRDQAESICDKCKDDQGAFIRVVTQFIHWQDPPPDQTQQEKISLKVLGAAVATTH